MEVETKLAFLFAGTGFSTPTTVKIGGKTCEVTNTTATTITCQMLLSEQLAIGIFAIIMSLRFGISRF